MKKKTLVGLILAVAIFSPILIPISVALLALVLVVWIFAMVMGGNRASHIQRMPSSAFARTP